MPKTSSILLILAIASCADHSDYEPVPVATDDHVMLVEDEPLELLTLAENDDNVGAVKVLDMPQHGTIVNGVYLPQPGYFGPDRFTYEGRYTQYSSIATEPVTAYIIIESDGIGYEQSSLLAETNGNDLAVGDVDGDGHIDLVTCDPGHNEMTVFRNTTTLEAHYSVEPYRFEGGSAPVRVALADLDGDNRLDIITATSNGLTILRNLTEPQGPLAFAEPVIIGNMITTGLAVADLDADGKPDVAAIEDIYYRDGLMHVWLNQSTPGAFTFGAQTSFATPPQPGRILAVEADTNGRADLAVLGKEKLALFVNATATGATVPAFSSRIDRGTAPYAMTMFLADLDGDARREIGVLHDYGVLWIYANRSTTSQTPSFEAARVIELPDATELVEPAELDGDGVIDLVGASGGTAPFSFLQNRSQPQDYAFELAEAKVSDISTRKTAQFATPRALAFVDLDGVAPLEIVVASHTSSGDGSGLRVLFGR